MNQRMEYFDILRPETVTNDWNEQVREWKRVKTIRAAVSVGGGGIKEKNELLRVESTHTGLTHADVQPGDRLRPVRGGDVYKVTYVLRGPRYRQLMLAKEAGVHEHAL